MKRKKLLAARSKIFMILLVAVAVSLAACVYKYNADLTDQKAKFSSSQAELKKKYQQLETLNEALYQAKEESKANDAASQQHIQQLEQEKADLEQKLQAKIEQKARLVAATRTVTQKVSQTLVPTVAAEGCGDNAYANYIYMHESGCRLTITNAEGCIGIGQACPAAKLRAVCPNLDYACQNQFFTAYAVARYGSWEGAYNSWLIKHWW